MAPALPPSGVHKVMLVNAADPGEIRVAILEDGHLTEIFVERQSQTQQTGNIYKGRVVSVEPSLQAAFIDIGGERNGFLHVSDCLAPDGGYSHILRPEASAKTRPEQPAQASAPLESRARVAPPQAPLAHPGSDRGSALALDTSEAPASTVAALEVPAEVAVEPAPLQSAEQARQGEGRVEEVAESRPNETAPEEGHGTGGEGEHEGEGMGEGDGNGDGNGNGNGEGSSEREGEGSRHGPSQTQDRGDQPQNGSSRTGLVDRQDRFRRFQGGPHRRYTIQGMLTRGQEVLVQVAKEGMGQKGPALTNFLSLPGRYLVLMPSVQRLGVSKRIEDDDRRRELKTTLNTLKVPKGMGVIVRTAGKECTPEKIRQDLDYLVQKWELLEEKTRTARPPTLVYQEGDVITRVFRDVFSDDVVEILIDDPGVEVRAREFLREIAPGAEQKVKGYKGQEPLFHRYRVEPQYQRLFNRKVALPGGGSIVIEQTEALVAIDVNTGRNREKNNQDDTILTTNLQAAREIARQLRLRDIGGLVMIDLIDMEIEEHKRRVEQELRSHLARDKARINMLPISSLGIVEMTRQRVRHSLRKTLFRRCTFCEGTGQLKSVESMGLEILRELRSVMSTGGFERGRVSLHPEVAFEILNAMRRKLTSLEDSNGRPIEVHGDPTLPLSQWRISISKSPGVWIHRKVSEVDDYVRNT